MHKMQKASIRHPDVSLQPRPLSRLRLRATRLLDEKEENSKCTSTSLRASSARFATKGPHSTRKALPNWKNRSKLTNRQLLDHMPNQEHPSIAQKELSRNPKSL